MAKTKVAIRYDETGRIVSVARPTKGAKAIALSGPGQSILETEVDEKQISDLVAGSHVVDVGRKTLIACDAPGRGKAAS